MHLQGYIEMDRPFRMAGIKKVFDREDIHLEKRQGTRSEARDYCFKDGNYVEFGDWQAGGQGRRNDLARVYKLIKEHKTKAEILDEHPTEFIKFNRGIEAAIAVVEKDETRDFRQVTVEVLHGDAGVGKTKSAHERFPDIFTVNSEETFPFDGYDGESAILLDDFYGGMKHSQLLRVLDGHQYRVNTKGGHRYARWTHVIITSNEAPDRWYRWGLSPALKRRLTTVTQLCNEVGGNTRPPPLSDDDIDTVLLELCGC